MRNASACKSVIGIILVLVITIVYRLKKALPGEGMVIVFVYFIVDRLKHGVA